MRTKWMNQKKTLLVFPALLLGLLLAGCGLDGGEAHDRVLPMADALRVEDKDLEAFPQMVQDVDRQADGAAASLHVWETAGDGTLLYIVYSLTVPDDWEQMLGNGTFRLNYDLRCAYTDPALAEQAPVELANLPQRYDPRLHTLYYLAIYHFPGGYTGQEISLEAKELTYYELEGDVPNTLEDVLTVAWTPANEAPVVTSEAGDCAVTPLRLDAAVPAEGLTAPDDETFEDESLRLSLCLKYQDGTAIQDAAQDTQADQEEKADEAVSAFGTLRAGWGDLIVNVTALPAMGSFFPLEGLTEVEVLGQPFAFSSTGG